MPGYGPFDLWVYEHALLVEVDGEQHDWASFGAVSSEEQMGRDRAKERAAVHAWQSVLSIALEAAMARRTARVHYTPSCPTPALLVAQPSPTFQERAGV